ncbi:MAG: hypothetical protein V4580_11245 [Bacteroidota bacterium]
MEPLITTVIALLTPYIIKSGEKFAEGVGEDLWNWIKKPFTKEQETELLTEAKTDVGMTKIVTLLSDKVATDASYKTELEKLVEAAQQKMNNYYQTINNTGNIEKQINIQENKGNIQM